MTGVGAQLSPYTMRLLWRRIVVEDATYDHHTRFFAHKLGQSRLMDADSFHASCDEFMLGRTKSKGFEHLRRLIFLFNLCSQAGNFALVALFRIHADIPLSHAIPMSSVSQPRVSIARLLSDSFPESFPDVFPVPL